MIDSIIAKRSQRKSREKLRSHSAQPVITGEIAGQGEYEIQAAFQKKDGTWKIGPLPGTQGCQAFLSS